MLELMLVAAVSLGVNAPAGTTGSVNGVGQGLWHVVASDQSHRWYVKGPYHSYGKARYVAHCLKGDGYCVVVKRRGHCWYVYYH